MKIKTFKGYNELTTQHVLNSLADADINASAEYGKIKVHPDNLDSAREHLNKIGHGYIKVSPTLNTQK